MVAVLGGLAAPHAPALQSVLFAHGEPSSHTPHQHRFIASLAFFSVHSGRVASIVHTTFDVDVPLVPSASWVICGPSGQSKLVELATAVPVPWRSQASW